VDLLDQRDVAALKAGADFDVPVVVDAEQVVVLLGRARWPAHRGL
jgi:hypothetical protein